MFRVLWTMAYNISLRRHPLWWSIPILIGPAVPPHIYFRVFLLATTFCPGPRSVNIRFIILTKFVISFNVHLDILIFF